jgi:PHD/YefM family antitoxin component YafN of YafNO toxin-antitoxin module
MMIRSATSLRNGYDEMVKLAKEKREPIYLTQNGDGEMVFVPLDLWEKREKELDMLFMLLQREQSRLAGVKISTMDEMERLTREILEAD